jgi:hypothetical protein
MDLPPTVAPAVVNKQGATVPRNRGRCGHYHCYSKRLGTNSNFSTTNKANSNVPTSEHATMMPKTFFELRRRTACHFIKGEKSYKYKEAVNTPPRTLEHFTQQLNTTSTTTPSLRSLPLKELLKVRSPSQAPHVGFNSHLSKDHLRLRLNSIEHAFMCFQSSQMTKMTKELNHFLKSLGIVAVDLHHQVQTRLEEMGRGTISSLSFLKIPSHISLDSTQETRM